MSRAEYAFVIKKSPISGKGGFAKRGIRQGEMIYPFTGQHVTGEEMLERVEAGTLGKDDALQIGYALYLILEETARSFNHSCLPNAGLRTNPRRHGEPDLFAMTNIAPDQEIVYDYSMTVGADDVPADWSMECACGTPECRSILRTFLTIPEDLLKKYVREGYAMDFIVEQARAAGVIK